VVVLKDSAAPKKDLVDNTMTVEAENNPARRNTPDQLGAVVSEEQYTEAVHELANFLNLDIADITSVDVLLKRIRYIGTDLRTVLLAARGVADKPLGKRIIGISEHTQETSFTVIAGPEKVDIQIFPLDAPRNRSSLLSVLLPVGDISRSASQPLKKAVLNAKEREQFYYPLAYPNDYNIQGFARGFTNIS
jgi:hypothetical protein